MEWKQIRVPSLSNITRDVFFPSDRLLSENGSFCLGAVALTADPYFLQTDFGPKHSINQKRSEKCTERQELSPITNKTSPPSEAVEVKNKCASIIGEILMYLIPLTLCQFHAVTVFSQICHQVIK